MRFFTHIVVQFEAEDLDEAYVKAEEYAESVEDLPDVIEAWPDNTEEE